MTPEQVALREKQLLGSWWRRRLEVLPGKMLANMPVFNLPGEMLMQADHRVLEIGCGSGSRLMIFDQRVKFRTVSGGGGGAAPPGPRGAGRAASAALPRGRGARVPRRGAAADGDPRRPGRAAVRRRRLRRGVLRRP